MIIKKELSGAEIADRIRKQLPNVIISVTGDIVDIFNYNENGEKEELESIDKNKIQTLLIDTDFKEVI